MALEEIISTGQVEGHLSAHLMSTTLQGAIFVDMIALLSWHQDIMIMLHKHIAMIAWITRSS
jgi:hypothetical protein